MIRMDRMDAFCDSFRALVKCTTRIHLVTGFAVSHNPQ